MRHRLPPDRDIDLRHAVSLDQDDQIRLLQRLAGEPDTPPPTRIRQHGRTFTHYGGTTKTGPRGAYVYTPTPIPPNVADADADVLILTVDHGDLDRRAFPRHPATIANLKAVIETALPLRGTHELRIHTPPRRWTAAHLEWFARTMAGYLPLSTTPGPIDFNVYGFHSNSIELAVRRATQWRAFRVSCEFSPIGIRPALEDWQTATGGWSASLGNEPLTAGPEPPDTAESVPEDDDLDPIEKACRRRLHDDHMIPPSSGNPRAATLQPSATHDESYGQKIIDILRLARTDYESFTTVHKIAADLLRGADDAGGR